MSTGDVELKEGEVGEGGCLERGESRSSCCVVSPGVSSSGDSLAGLLGGGAAPTVAFHVAARISHLRCTQALGLFWSPIRSKDCVNMAVGAVLAALMGVNIEGVL